jgi:hypothetical protein
VHIQRIHGQLVKFFQDNLDDKEENVWKTSHQILLLKQTMFIEQNIILLNKLFV